MTEEQRKTNTIQLQEMLAKSTIKELLAFYKSELRRAESRQHELLQGRKESIERLHKQITGYNNGALSSALLLRQKFDKSIKWQNNLVEVLEVKVELLENWGDEHAD